MLDSFIKRGMPVCGIHALLLQYYIGVTELKPMFSEKEKKLTGSV